MIRRITPVSILFTALCAALLGACSGSAPAGSPAGNPSPTTIPSNIAPATPALPSATTPAPNPTMSRWRIAGISILDAQHMWVLRTRDLESQILASDGVRWTEQYRGGLLAARMQFVDREHGWVVGANGGPDCHFIPHPNCRGAMLSTQDGGTSWQESSPSDLWLRDVAFVDAADGWAIASSECGPCQTHPTTLLKTSDGGITWKGTPLTLDWDGTRRLRVFRTTAEDGTIVERNNVLRTSDGGATWTAIPSGCAMSKAFGVLAQFIDSLHGWTLCEDGKAGGTVVEKFLYNTVDGGNTWKLVAENLFGAEEAVPGVGLLPGAFVADLSFSSERDGWMAVGEPVAGTFSTRDGGATWTALPWRDQGYGPARAAMLTTSLGAIVTMKNLWLTEDGGAKWRELPLPVE